MNMEDLELYTTQELINELVRRHTFLGVVVQSAEACKNSDWTGERIFKVHFNSNLDSEQASRLLNAVSDYMQSDCG